MRCASLLAFCVLLSGLGRSTKAVAEAPSRPSEALYGAQQTTWIVAAPAAGSERLGYFRGGRSVRLRSLEKVSGSGCREGYYAIEPRGYVCAGASVTLDPGDRRVRVQALVSASLSSRPFRFAISNGAPMYRRLPSAEEWARAERDLGAAGTFKRYRWNEKHERLAEVAPIPPSGDVPFFLMDGGSARSEREKELVRMYIPLGSTVAFTRAFAHAGRTWLLTSDGTLVPADRVRPFRESGFRGVKGSALRLPFAWVRGEPAEKYRRAPDGEVSAQKETFSRYSVVPLEPDAKAIQDGGKRFFAVEERAAGAGALFVSADSVAHVHAPERAPDVSKSEKWIAVDISEGTLIAFEGKRPVFATLVSPGSGGISRPGVDPVKASTTPRGAYRVQYKYRTHTMSPQKDKPETERTFWLSEVPFAHFFQVPFALHTAYWHENFGEWISGGCVNLSPEDAKWLFDWSDPALPHGWDAVLAGAANGKGTRLFIER